MDEVMKDELATIVKEGFQEKAEEVKVTVLDAVDEKLAPISDEVKALKEKAEETQKAMEAKVESLLKLARKEHVKRGYFLAGDKYVSLTDHFRAAAAMRGLVRRAPKNWTKEEFANWHEQKALQEGTDSEGGYLVPDEVNATIISLLTEQDIISRYVSRLTTSRDVVKINSESTAPAGSFIAEEASVSAGTTEPVFAQTSISVYKYGLLFLVSSELMADAVSNIGDYLTQRAAEVIAYDVQKYIIAGSGSSQPSGIIQANVPTENKEAYTLGSAPKYTDYVNTYMKLAQRYRRAAVWLMTSLSKAGLVGMVDTNEQPVFSASPTQEVFEQLFGKPIIEDDNVDTVNTTQYTQDIYLVDPRRYVMVENGGLRFDVSRDYKFDTDQLALRFIKRWGGSYIGTAGIAQLYAS